MLLQRLDLRLQLGHPAVLLEIVVRQVELQHHIPHIIGQSPVGGIIRKLPQLSIQIGSDLPEVVLALHPAEGDGLAADRDIDIIFYCHFAFPPGDKMLILSSKKLHI